MKHQLNVMSIDNIQGLQFLLGKRGRELGMLLFVKDGNFDTTDHM